MTTEDRDERPVADKDALQRALGESTAPPARTREVSDDDLRAVVEGWFHDPHGVLGTHLTSDGWVVRTLRPDAVAVAVLDQDGSRYEATPLHPGGIYEAALPQQPGDYR